MEKWVYKYKNFKKVFLLVEKGIEVDNPNELEIAGIVQYFELCMERAWKTLKAYLEFNGLSPNSPRESIKMAFANNMISDGDIWIEALESRNITSHDYDFTTATEIINKIKNEYYLTLNKFSNEYGKKI